jgi:hypothetical protein
MRPPAAIKGEALPGLVQNRDLSFFPDRRRLHSANGSDRHVERLRQFGQLIERRQWRSEEDLVIVAARKHSRDVPGVEPVFGWPAAGGDDLLDRLLGELPMDWVEQRRTLGLPAH